MHQDLVFPRSVEEPIQRGLVVCGCSVCYTKRSSLLSTCSYLSINSRATISLYAISHLQEQLWVTFKQFLPAVDMSVCRSIVKEKHLAKHVFRFFTHFNVIALAMSSSVPTPYQLREEYLSYQFEFESFLKTMLTTRNDWTLRKVSSRLIGNVQREGIFYRE